ncbi:MAG TPA: substrate-binding domain-containing protein [Candidatus Cybelea sp.]|jgi:ABC-type phosphate transport system substrate-binding protein|nr:substrate-binding domain-containing protein [Candidatus Cybelea sp.]
MRKTIATLALAALPALLLSACNGSNAGGSSVAPLPNAPNVVSHHGHGRAHRNDNGPQDLHSGGATFPAYGYNQGNQPVGYYYNAQQPPGAGSIFYAVPTTGTVYYCLTGSGAGRHAFEDYMDSSAPPTGPCAPLGATATGFGGRSDPLDFVGSDVAMPSTEYTQYKATREPSSGTNWGEPFEFPTFGGPIVFGYRSKDFGGNKKVKLSTWTYCAIANGTIGDWNDPAITADNGGHSVTGGNSESITFYFRSDSSGTSYLFTNKLANTTSGCNQTFNAPYNTAPYGYGSRSAAWTFGVNMVWPGPGSSNDPNARFVGENGNPGVLAAIQSTPFGTGYVEGAWAKSANPPIAQAWLLNGKVNGRPEFISPTNQAAVTKALAKVTSANITYGEGSDEQPLGTSTPWCILYIDPSKFVSPPGGTYPIVGFSYWLFYGNNNGVHVSDKETLVKYIASAPANKVVNKLEYAPLSASIHTAITNALNGIANGSGQGSGQPCLQ